MRRPQKPFLGPHKSYFKEEKSYMDEQKKVDMPLLISVVLAVMLGLIIVYDASVFQAIKDFGDKYFYIKQQILWVFLGFLAVSFFSFFEYHNFKKIAPILFIISFVLLLSVFIPGLGIAAGGAHRWLKLGYFTIQPTEIIKLTSIILFASIFEKKVKDLVFLFITGIIVVILGLFQKDLGSTIVFFLAVSSLYIVAGAKILYFFIASPFIIGGFIYFIISSTYRIKRVLAFLDPFSDPQGFSYHIAQVLIALGSGGWFGLGLGQSRQKFQYIPEVTTDSIFAIVGEELGFVGSLFLIGLLTFIVYRGFQISQNTDDNFGKLLSFGLSCWLGIQITINLAAMVSLIPLTGVPLPFISYGGSALMVNLTAVGILLNISKNSKV